MCFGGHSSAPAIVAPATPVLQAPVAPQAAQAPLATGKVAAASSVGGGGMVSPSLDPLVPGASGVGTARAKSQAGVAALGVTNILGGVLTGGQTAGSPGQLGLVARLGG